MFCSADIRNDEFALAAGGRVDFFDNGKFYPDEIAQKAGKPGCQKVFYLFGIITARV